MVFCARGLYCVASRHSFTTSPLSFLCGLWPWESPPPLQVSTFTFANKGLMGARKTAVYSGGCQGPSTGCHGFVTPVGDFATSGCGSGPASILAQLLSMLVHNLCPYADYVTEHNLPFLCLFPFFFCTGHSDILREPQELAADTCQRLLSDS